MANFNIQVRKMQGAIQAIRSRGGVLKSAILRHVRIVNPAMLPTVFSHFQSVSSSRLEEHGFESTTIADILKDKGKSADGSWLWCTTEETVYDAVKSVCILLLFNISCSVRELPFSL